MKTGTQEHCGEIYEPVETETALAMIAVGVVLYVETKEYIAKQLFRPAVSTNIWQEHWRDVAPDVIFFRKVEP